jgi:tetratricopeptide (TPR) repeat protein
VIEEPFGEAAMEAMSGLGGAELSELGQPRQLPGETGTEHEDAEHEGTEHEGTDREGTDREGPRGSEPGDSEPGDSEPGDREGARGSQPSDREPGEGAQEAKPPAKPTARFLTITIVLATFIAALGGFLLNRASSSAANAGDVAQELSLQAGAAGTGAYQQAETDYAQYLSLQSLDAKAAQEMLEATYDQNGTLSWLDQYHATVAQAEQTAQAVPADLRPTLANGDPDPDFPYDFFAERAFTGTYLGAQSDAYNDASNRWSGLVDNYTAILTMIAVALFLFGSAYVLYGRNRVVFTALGIVLVATGLAWGGGLAVAKQPATPSDRAARAYADGVTAMDAVTSQGGYAVPIKDFTEAIRLRPDYALAYSERASAEALRGSEAIGAGFVSAVSPHWARLAAADELEAYDLGDHDASQVLNVGWSYYQLWVADGFRGRPPLAALGFFRQASQLDPTNAADWLDLGTAEVAEGDYKAATQAYVAGVTHMLYTCARGDDLATCRAPQPLTSYGLEQALLAGGMESLETIAGTRLAEGSPSMRSAIASLEGLLTDSMASGKVVVGPYAPAVRVPGMEGFLDPNYLELDVPVPAGTSALKMASMPLTVLWYERPVGATRWSAISETACWGHGHQECGSYNRFYNTFQFVTRFLAADNECFTNVEYRAELYVGGSLAGSLSLSPTDDYISTNLAPALDKAMDVGICAPASWRRQPVLRVKLPVYGTTATVIGPLTTSEMSYTSRGGTEGVYLFRLYPPRSTPSGAPVSMSDLVQESENDALDLLRGRGLPVDIAPTGPAEPHSIWGGAVSDMTTTAYVSQKTGVEAFAGAAVIAPEGAEAEPTVQDRSIAADVPGDYAVVVTVVFGPETSKLWSGQHSLGLQIFSSWSLLNYG